MRALLQECESCAHSRRLCRGYIQVCVTAAPSPASLFIALHAPRCHNAVVWKRHAACGVLDGPVLHALLGYPVLGVPSAACAPLRPRVLMLCVCGARPELEGFAPYAITAATPSEGVWQDVVFVASQSTVLGLRCPLGPSSSDDAVAEVLVSLVCSGEVRGLHAAGPFLFCCDNNGLSTWDTRNYVPGSAAVLAPLHNANKALAAVSGERPQHVTDIHVLTLSSSQASRDLVTGYLVLVAYPGKLVLVEANSLSPAMTFACTVAPGPDVPDWAPARISYLPASATVYVADAAGASVSSFTLPLSTLSQRLQEVKIGATGARGGRAKPHPPSPPLTIVPEPVVAVAGDALPPSKTLYIGLAVTHSSLPLLSLSSSSRGRLSLFSTAVSHSPLFSPTAAAAEEPALHLSTSPVQFVPIAPVGRADPALHLKLLMQIGELSSQLAFAQVGRRRL